MQYSAPLGYEVDAAQLIPGMFRPRPCERLESLHGLTRPHNGVLPPGCVGFRDHRESDVPRGFGRTLPRNGERDLIYA